MSIGNVNMTNMQKYQQNMAVQNVKAARTNTNLENNNEVSRVIKENEQNKSQQIPDPNGTGRTIDYKI